MQQQLQYTRTSRSWYALVIYSAALLQLLLLTISLVVAFTPADVLYRPHLSEVLIVIPLLGYLGLGYYAQHTSGASTIQVVRIGTLFGIGQGIILGLLFLLPYPHLVIRVIFEIFTLPSELSSRLSSAAPVHTQTTPIFTLLLVHTLLSLCSYATCAFWVARRTGSAIRGYSSALLATFITALITTVTVALIYHAPLLIAKPPLNTSLYQIDPADITFSFPLNYLDNYRNVFLSALASIFSQFVLALIGGLIGVICIRQIPSYVHQQRLHARTPTGELRDASHE